MRKGLRSLMAGIACLAVLASGMGIGWTIARNADQPQTQSSEVSTPYVDSTQNANVLIRMPDLRQYSTFTCGTTCVQMVMNWARPQQGDINLADLQDALGTTDEGGTTPDNIVAYLKGQGVDATLRQGMTSDDLAATVSEGHPVVMGIQAWSTAEDGSYNTDDPSDKDTYLVEGHYVICVGYRQTHAGYDFYFNDPANVGICMMASAELDSRWIDMDAHGTVYDHTGIVINADTNYDPDGVYHLD